ncbi:AraC family transcriptional regulator [Paenibacillus sambharensis]|nr:AraC family transcriptional regulator [Paenibacillus sambharensis]
MKEFTHIVHSGLTAVILMVNVQFTANVTDYLITGEEVNLNQSELPDGKLNTLVHTELPSLESTVKLFASHYRLVAPDWSYPEHTHPLFEINLVTEGAQLMRVNGAEHLMEAGDLLIIPPNQAHESRVAAGEPMGYFCLHFDSDDKPFRQMLMRTRLVFPADSRLNGMIRPALDKLMELSKHNGPFLLSQRMQALSSMFELFAALGDMLSEEGEGGANLSGQAMEMAGAMAGMIERAVQEAEGDSASAEQLLIADIASELGYSSSYCNRIFHLVYGMSPRQYLSSLKLKQARLLLLDHRLSIEQIAFKLGYRDISHFSRQFKRWTGVPPSRYRQYYSSGG